MGAKFRRRLAAGQKTKKANDLERNLQQAFAAVEQRLGLLAEVLDAAVDLIGRDMVAKNVERLRRERANEALQKALDAGQLVAADTVTTDSLVECTEFPPTGDDTQGSATPSESRVLHFSQFIPEAQKDLLCRKVGDSIATPNGGRLEITGIYATPQTPQHALGDDDVTVVP